VATKGKRKKKMQVNNLVAKYMYKVHKHSVQRDKTKYTRKQKHKEKEHD